jgi:hypothetical protein
MDVTVNAPTTPTFTQVGSYCQNATATILPTTSENGILGTWNAPISTASAGTTTYTYTPTSIATPTCATTTTMDVTVNAPTTPTFTQVGPYCQNATATILPTTSENGIVGTWNSPISTAPAGTTTYTFTPASIATPTCPITSTMDVTVNPLPTVTLSAFNSVCDTTGIVNLTGGSPLGGIYSGTSVSNNVFNTSVGVGSYPIIYSYVDANGCESSSSKDITVIQCSAAGLDDLDNSNIILYPNPTNDKLTLGVLDDLLGKQYIITDFSGRLILKGKINMLNQIIELTNVSNGSYLLQVENSNAKAIKIVKQ